MIRKITALTSAMAMGTALSISLVAPAGANHVGADPQYADFVVSSTTTGSGPYGPHFSTANVLGAPDGGPMDGWYNLGTGTGAAGTIVLRFDDNVVINGTGADLTVYEAHSFGATGVDQAAVYVSQDGVGFTYVGTAYDNPTASNGTYANSFDIGMAWAKYVKIVNGDDPSLDPGGADGFDLDAVEAVHWSDDFVLVDASLDEPLATYFHETRKPDYSVSGFAGNNEAGVAFGMIEVRYHNTKITCTFVPGSAGTFVLRESSVDLGVGYSFEGDTTDVPFDVATLTGWAYTCNNGDSGIGTVAWVPLDRGYAHTFAL